MRGILSALSLAACFGAPALAYAQEAPAQPVETPAAVTDAADPWEGTNRNLFAFHESVDRAVLEPVARGYRAVTPRPVRTGVLNFLRNLRGPVIFANDVLQGEFSRAGTTAARFGVNTTIGIGGVFDPATVMGLERHDEDFGQTLAVWGVDSGPYIFVPLMGPTTVRDGAGRIVDMAFDPLTWAEFDEAGAVRATRGVMTGVAAREGVIETVDDIRRDSLDPYVTIRSSYGLLRASAIENGATNVEDLPEFEAIGEEPAMETPPPALEAPQPAPEQRDGDKGVTEDNAQQVSDNQISSAPVTLAQASYVSISG